MAEYEFPHALKGLGYAFAVGRLEHFLKSRKFIRFFFFDVLA